MDSKGFTLIEMLIVVFIISVLLALAALNFNAWETRYRIGDEAREMMQDLTNMRMSAIQTKSNYMAILTTNNAMTFRKYTTNELVTATNGVQTFSKTLDYPVSNSPTGTASCANIQVDARGYTIFPLNPNGTSEYTESWQVIYVLPTGTQSGYDCMSVSNVKINIGKYNGTGCVFK